MDDRDRLGRAQSELLGDELADHQREIGGERDHDDEADIVRPLGAHPEGLDPLAHRLAERGARDGAGDDPDQGDAELHRGEELARVGGQQDRHFGALVALLGRHPEPRRASRDDGELG